MTERISFCLILSNEEELLGRCLESLAPVAWEVVAYLNACTDGTAALLRGWSEASGIPVRILDGYWDDDFARARNAALLVADGSHVAIVDADDILLAPARVLAAVREDPGASQHWRVRYGRTSFFQLRLWPNQAAPLRAHYHGRCHEYVELGPEARLVTLEPDVLEHRPSPRKSSTGRNVRILEAALQGGPRPCALCNKPDNAVGRVLFYLANAYRERGDHRSALATYDRYLKDGHGWRDERLMAHLYRAQSLTAMGQPEKARRAALDAIVIDPTWAEPYLQAAHSLFAEGRWALAARWATLAADMPRPVTPMFLDDAAYAEEPWRLMSRCAEHEGDVARALTFARAAAARMPEPDPAWLERLERLERAVTT